MQVLEMNRTNSGPNMGLLMGMHRLRRKVFKDRLEWAVSLTGDLEMDRFDALDASYLIVKEGNSVLGSVRLLPTTGPNMLADTFPELLDGGSAPNCDSIAESSRFCVDTTATDAITEGGLRHLLECWSGGGLVICDPSRLSPTYAWREFCGARAGRSIGSALPAGLE